MADLPAAITALLLEWSTAIDTHRRGAHLLSPDEVTMLDFCWTQLSHVLVEQAAAHERPET